ncbi:MAG: hypothetical protein PHS82_03340 [Lachnospiraceae bacterium]|nr:hypothetical protein [Lachnospiraceae bacterium]
MLTTVVFDEETLEIICIIPMKLTTDGTYTHWYSEHTICKTGYAVATYSETEPIFNNRDGKVYLVKNKFTLPNDYLN